MSDVARKRWRLLGRILLERGSRLCDKPGENVLGDSSVSVRRFASFGLFIIKHVERDEKTDDEENKHNCEQIKGPVGIKEEGDPNICKPKEKDTNIVDNEASNKGQTNVLQEQMTVRDESFESNVEAVNQTDRPMTKRQWEEEIQEIQRDNKRCKQSDIDLLKDDTGNECGSHLNFRGHADSQPSIKCSGRVVSQRHHWYNYTSTHFPHFSLNVRHLDSSTVLSNLLCFNNTGNVCVWPSEEVLTYYCLKHSDWFIDCSVCELGGGMTCLASLAIAVTTQAKRILATDGNQLSINNLSAMLNRNRDRLKARVVDVKLLLWDDDVELENLSSKFDFVVCADCLFFDQSRYSLLRAISLLLRPSGRALLFAPRRGETFDKFLQLVSDSRDSLHLSALTDASASGENYDDYIYQLHAQQISENANYNESLHYPRLLTLVKDS